MSEWGSWTPEREDEITLRWGRGETASTISRAMGCSRSAVIGKAHRLGLAERKSPIKRTAIWEDAQTERLKERYAVGLGLRKLALEFNCGRETLRVRLRELNLAEPIRAIKPAVAKAPRPPRIRIAKPAVVRLPRPVMPPATIYVGRVVECTYVVSGQKRSAVYCDQPTLPGRSYCGEHHGICIRKDPREATPAAVANMVHRPKSTWTDARTLEEV